MPIRLVCHTEMEGGPAAGEIISSTLNNDWTRVSMCNARAWFFSTPSFSTPQGSIPVPSEVIFSLHTIPL